jgi:tetratricopeptide (TPR) repeat protein
VHGRWLQWQLTADLLRDHPLLGVGPSRYVDAFGRYESVQWSRFTGPAVFADSPHNMVLQVWATGGVALALVAAAIVVVVVRRGLAAARESALGLGLAAAVGGYLLAMLANFTIAGSTCLAAFLAGALVAVDPRPERASRVRERWVVVVGSSVAVATAVALFAACASEIRLADGVKALDAGDLASAQRDFAQARELRPVDPDLAMLEAQAYAAAADAGMPEAVAPAARLARRSLAHTPQTYASRLSLAVADLLAGRPSRSQERLDRLVRDYPARAELYLERAIVRARSGDRAGVLEDLTHAHQIAPRDPNVARLLRKVRGSQIPTS